ncbi:MULTISPECIES: hypothetical protein [Pyrobaculum]|uniref:Uncharacterized protein n=2 Tax=Pyrobaculum arsenaticum TaxID=121277 RepID=A4WMK5_PYRAR|nr:hypothetical protein [Pyrobaculum arsenaticum]ABP51622.1 conserved hypothetical protein [Pyrobaculum arsenaticum DSM 13514]MCY0890645.1 hypothetical protein [Pyrobaculum arsenaticum]NYR15941.1 hypothetical protein [Pyrobaculum arsenaticum]
MDLKQLIEPIAQYMSHPVVGGWVWFMIIAFFLAFIASIPPRRPLGEWVGDLFIRWGLAGILVWFVVNGIWAIREVMGQRLIVPFSPIEGYLEYATVWSAVLTGMATFLFFGSALLLRAIFAREEIPKGVVYYRQEVLVMDPSAQTSAPQAERKIPAVVVDNRREKKR